MQGLFGPEDHVTASCKDTLKSKLKSLTQTEWPLPISLPFSSFHQSDKELHSVICKVLLTAPHWEVTDDFL